MPGGSFNQPFFEGYTERLKPIHGPLLSRGTAFGWINFFRTSLYQLNKDCADQRDDFLAGRNSARGYPWFSPRDLVNHASKRSGGPPAYYYAGSYLQGMLSALAVTQGLMLLPLVITMPGQDARQFLIDLTILLIMLVAIRFRAARITRRRVILEDELLSIHSCAIVWEAVVVCHYEALSGGLEHYTERLTEAAQRLASDPFAIHSWLAGPRVSTSHRGRHRRDLK